MANEWGEGHCVGVGRWSGLGVVFKHLRAREIGKGRIVGRAELCVEAVVGAREVRAERRVVITIRGWR